MAEWLTALEDFGVEQQHGSGDGEGGGGRGAAGEPL
eukprot:COSAG04_NODE_24324_length_323_cov_1.142857_2_plen_35_part_01